MDDEPPFPEPHVVRPTSPHTHTAILLHGRGSNGKEFAEELFQGEMFSQMTLPEYFPSFKWVFPSARPSFSTVFQEDLVEWFDIYSLSDPGLEEELQIDGLLESVVLIHDLVENEAQILGSSGRGKIVLGGISQGCAAALTALLSGVCGIGAFVGFNGWMPLADRVQELVLQLVNTRHFSEKQKCERLAAGLQHRLSPNQESDLLLPGPVVDDSSARPEESRHLHTPIFLSHTADDEVIDIGLGHQMYETLMELDMHNVVWKEYETGGHWIPEAEGFEDVAGFISDVVF